MARRDGVKCISGLIYEDTRGVLKVFLGNVIRDAVAYTRNARLSQPWTPSMPLGFRADPIRLRWPIYIVDDEWTVGDIVAV